MKVLSSRLEGWVQRTLGRWAPEKSESGEANPERSRPLVLAVLVVGLLLLWLGRPQDPGGGSPGDVDRGSVAPGLSVIGLQERTYEDELARSLAALLAEIQGAGRVSVFISLEGGEERVLAYETEESWTQTQEGGPDAMLQTEERRSSSRPALMREERGEGPLVTLTRRPAVRGALVVADGAADPAVRRRLAQAVQAALGAPAHRVEVLPRAAR